MKDLSNIILSLLLPFATLFSRCQWEKALWMLIGALLCRGKRTVSSILRVLGLSEASGFSKFHRLLNQSAWSALSGSKILLQLLLQLNREGPLVFHIDETLERRKGKKIRAKGLYRDAVRSSKKIVVHSRGLKWLVVALEHRFPFLARWVSLPFLTILQPSQKEEDNGKTRYKTSTDWTRQAFLQVLYWTGSSPVVFVGDGAFAVGELAWTCLRASAKHFSNAVTNHRAVLVTRMKINSRLYELPPPRLPGQRGRTAKKGPRQLSFQQMVTTPGLPWKQFLTSEKKLRNYLSNVSIWAPDGCEPLPIRWVLVVDPEGKEDPIALMSTDPEMTPERIIQLYPRRWGIEVVFEEARAHLGVETQRQWSDLAIARVTPILFSLYTIVHLMCSRLVEAGETIEVEQTAWYAKKAPTFSDLLQTVRRPLWRHYLFLRKCKSERILGNITESETAALEDVDFFISRFLSTG